MGERPLSKSPPFMHFLCALILQPESLDSSTSNDSRGIRNNGEWCGYLSFQHNFCDISSVRPPIFVVRPRKPCCCAQLGCPPLDERGTVMDGFPTQKEGRLMAIMDPCAAHAMLTLWVIPTSECVKCQIRPRGSQDGG